MNNLWTSLQYPFFQANRVENGKVIQKIPTNYPHTPSRKIWNVGKYNDRLMILRHSSFELWDINGNEQLLGFPCKYIYGPHGIQQHKEDILICSTYLNMFFIMDINGNIKWKWEAHKYGLCDKIIDYDSNEWEIIQNKHDSILYTQFESDLHFNSIFLPSIDSDFFITSSLKTGSIFKIYPYTDKCEIIFNTELIGIHSPILYDDKLIFGLETGIYYNGDIILTEFNWIKHIRNVGDGFIFSHGSGITKTDNDFNILETVDLPMPWIFFTY